MIYLCANHHTPYHYFYDNNYVYSYNYKNNSTYKQKIDISLRKVDDQEDVALVYALLIYSLLPEEKDIIKAYTKDDFWNRIETIIYENI